MGRVSVVPELTAALVSKARDVFTDPDLWDDEPVSVFDGYGNSDDPGCYLMIGVDDPDDGGLAKSAESQQDWAHANGRARTEEGDISCAAMAWNGGGDGAQQVVRELAYAIAAQVSDLCRTDPTLDVDGVLWTSFGTSASLSQDSNDQGVLALLLFRIHFKARI